MRFLQIVTYKITVFGREGATFWQTMKRNIEETGENLFSMSPKKMFVDSDAAKGSQDEGTN